MAPGEPWPAEWICWIQEIWFNCDCAYLLHQMCCPLVQVQRWLVSSLGSLAAQEIEAKRHGSLQATQPAQQGKPPWLHVYMLQAFFANHDCPVFAQPTWLGAFTHGVDEEARFMNSSKACVQHFMLTQDQHAKAFGILVLSHQAILFFTSGQCEDKGYVFSVSKFSDASCANSIKTKLVFCKICAVHIKNLDAQKAKYWICWTWNHWFSLLLTT